MRTMRSPILVAAVLALALVACGEDEDSAERALEDALDEAAEALESAGDEGSEAAVEDDDEGDGEGDGASEDGDGGSEGDDTGSADSGGGELPDGLPDDVPIPDDATVRGGTKQEGSLTAWVVDLAFDADVEDVTSGYTDALEEHEWEEARTRDEPNGTYTSARKGDDLELSFKVIESEDGQTLATITVNKR